MHDMTETAGRTEGADVAVSGGAAESSGSSRPVSRPRALARDAIARVPRRWRLPLATYLACQAIFLFWWAAFYPGLMAYDSIIYMLHVTTGPWVADHSVLYDSLVWLSLRTTGDLGALTLGQTAVMSAALAYTVAAFRRLRVPGRWTAIAAVAVAALPPTGTFFVFVWKDVGFAICVYLVVPTMAHLVSIRGLPEAGPRRQVNWLIGALGLELLGICLFRPNGFVVVAIAAVVAVLTARGLRARIAAAAAAAIFFSFVLNFYAYPAVGIIRPPATLTYGPVYADIAVAYAADPSTFTVADTDLMAKVAPLPLWRQTANCYISDTTTRIPGFFARSERYSKRLFRIWLRVLGRTPELIIGARICRGSIAWVIFPGHNTHAFTYLSAIPADLFGLATARDVRHNPYRADLATRPVWGALNPPAVFLRTASQVPQLEWLLWRGATWCYVAYLALGLLARRRRDLRLLAPGAIVAGQQLGVLADNPSQLFRYMASPIFIGMMLVPVLLSAARPATAAGHVDEAASGTAPPAAAAPPS